MDYEKKFKDFLGRIQGLLDNAKKQGHIIVRVEDLENAFPELKENKDERIRKELISFVSNDGWKFTKLTKEEKESWIAWLEKQVEQKPYGQREECFNCQFNYAGHCKGYCELKRQGQSKPTIPYKAIREGVAHFGITQYQIDNWLKKYVNVEGESQSTFQQCKQEGDRIVKNPDGTHFSLSQLERVAKAETPEESLGISSEEYNKIVNECIFGELKETGKESNSNDKLDPLIDEEIDLWIKENKDIHHDNNNIVGLMRDMAYYVATLTRNLYRYRQKSKWTKEDSLETETLINSIKYGLSISFELKDKFITWLKSLKQRMEEQQ